MPSIIRNARNGKLFSHESKFGCKISREKETRMNRMKREKRCSSDRGAENDLDKARFRWGFSCAAVTAQCIRVHIVYSLSVDGQRQ